MPVACQTHTTVARKACRDHNNTHSPAASDIFYPYAALDTIRLILLLLLLLPHSSRATNMQLESKQGQMVTGEKHACFW